jgi:hypothetical protein
MADLITTVASFATNSTSTVTIPKEYAWDFENDDFLLVDGKFKIVTGAEALKVWMWRSLRTPNSIYAAYSTSYGSNMDDLVGKGYSTELIETEAQRIVWECISYNSHIKGISEFSISTAGDILAVSFIAETDQGEVTLSDV